MIVYQQPKYPPCQKLKEIREEKGLTQTQLSFMLVQAGYSIQAHFISKFELGYRRPWANAKRGISEVLDIPESSIF